MNRVLFLPLNRNTVYFMKRALLRGHLPFFVRWGIEAQKSHSSKWFIPEFFKDDYWRLVRDDYRESYFYWKSKWVKYFKFFKISHLVTDMEANIAVISALDTAKVMGITRSYVMHGPGDIYDIPSNLSWYNSGVYDYFYSRSDYVAEWVKSGSNIIQYEDVDFKEQSSVETEDCLTFNLNADVYGEIKRIPTVHKFNKPVKKFKTPTTFPERRTVLYAPMFNWPTKVGLTGLLLDNETRRVYNEFIINFLYQYNCNILYCHDPKLDTERHESTYRMLEMLHISGKMKWIKDKAVKYLDQCNIAMTDCGSGFFIDAINSGKPTLCLHHINAAGVKPGTDVMFGDSLQWFSDFKNFEWKLDDFMNTKTVIRYIPKSYLDREEKVKNDPLIWEMRR